MPNVTHLIDHIEDILDVAKQVKAGKSRYQGAQKKEQEARDEVKTLQREAHAITTAMVNNDDMSVHRELSVVQRDLLRAHNKVDAAIDKSNTDTEKMEEACERLEALVGGEVPESQAESDEEPSVEHGPGIVVEQSEDVLMDEHREAVNA